MCQVFQALIPIQPCSVQCLFSVASEEEICALTGMTAAAARQHLREACILSRLEALNLPYSQESLAACSR